MKARLLFAALLMAASTQASGQAYRCTDVSGATRYQGQPCSDQGEEMSQSRVSITPSQPVEPLPQPTRPSAHDRADAATDRVQQIRRENANPELCAQARAGLARAEAADPAGLDVSIFEMRQKVVLYCEDI